MYGIVALYAAVFAFTALSAIMWARTDTYGMAALSLFMLAGLIWLGVVTIRLVVHVRALLDKIQKERPLEEIERERMRMEEAAPQFVRILDVIDKYVDLTVRENDTESMLRQMELMTLQNQINPHFLYNTLDTIRGQALMDHDTVVAEMVESLSVFFRYSISRAGNIVTLREELNNIKHYIRIQQFRFQNRFELEILIEEDESYLYDCYIPRLTLQPIIENAIIHGFRDIYHGGIITVEVGAAENMIVLISDNGSGMSLEQLAKINLRIHQSYRKTHYGENLQGERKNASREENGIALLNVHRRIQMLYGPEYGVNLYSSLGQGTDVEIVLPLVNAAHSNHD